MTEATWILLSAAGFFLVSHLVLASMPVRTVLAEKIGAGGHRILFSVVSVGAFVWMLMAYGDARYEGNFLWVLPPGVSMIPIFVMPIVCILIVASVSSRNPMAVGGEKLLADPNPVQGIMTVTRHPMMVGIALWAVTHMIVNGDVASIILFGGILALTVLGMIHMDHRRQAVAGSDWGPMALSTSVVPFLAAIQGRTKVDWRGIGLFRVAGGLVLYGLLVGAHPLIAGVGIAG